jgi:hypothetical protein
MLRNVELTVDAGVFNVELMAGRPEAGDVWAESRLCDRIDATIALEDAEGLTGDHVLAEAMAPDTALPITERARQIRRTGRSAGNSRSGDVIHYLTVGHLDPVALRECAAVATKPLGETSGRN